MFPIPVNFDKVPPAFLSKLVFHGRSLATGQCWQPLLFYYTLDMDFVIFMASLTFQGITDYTVYIGYLVLMAAT